MQITVNVADIDLDTVLADFYDEEGDRQGQQTLGTLVAAKVASAVTRHDEWPGLRKQVADIRTAKIRAAIKEQVVDAMNAPIQQTNSYGEPKGGTTTLRELIGAEVTKFLTQPVPTRDGYNAPHRTGAQDVVATAVRDVLGKELAAEVSAAIKAEKEKVVAAIRAKGAELLAEAVKQGVGLR